MKILIKHLSPRKLKINRKARKWCKLPYPGHKDGCPNYGKRKDCPPKVPILHKVLNLRQRICLVIVRFNLERHIKRMKKKHPEWSDRQARCVLYWQNTVRARMKRTVKRTMKKYRFDFWTDKPEALGIQVITTCRKLGIPIKPKPKKFVYKVALLGYSKSNNLCQMEIDTGEWEE